MSICIFFLENKKHLNACAVLALSDQFTFSLQIKIVGSISWITDQKWKYNLTYFYSLAAYRELNYQPE